jgi:hypothetical protein
MVRRLFTLTALFALSACTSVQIGDQGGKIHHYFGFVSVQVPEVTQALEAYKVTSYGLAIENGLMVGARDTERVLVPLRTNQAGSQPHEATCALVVIVRSHAEARHARNTLKDIEGENLCLVSYQ